MRTGLDLVGVFVGIKSVTLVVTAGSMDMDMAFLTIAVTEQHIPNHGGINTGEKLPARKIQ